MSIKLSPKIKFCPGCPGKKLELKSVPTVILPEDKPEDELKTVTIIGKKTTQKKIGGLF